MSEGYAFNAWYICKVGPREAVFGGGFTPVRAWMEWQEKKR